MGKENEQLLGNFDASKIMELVGQQKLVEKVVEHLTPSSNGILKDSPKDPAGDPLKDGSKDPGKNEVNSTYSKTKGHKTYTIPAGTPAYTPTPLAVLKRTKPVGSKDDGFIPSNPVSKSTTATYKPSKPSKNNHKNRVDEYSPSLSDLAPDINYTPSSRDSNNIIRDQYTPPSNYSNSNINVDYQPTNKALSSIEPSYMPVGNCTEVEYSPSSIGTLTTEPGYSPAPSSHQPQLANYTPSSFTIKGDECEDPISPETYLAMLEVEEVAPSKKSSRQRDEEREEKRRKEHEKKIKKRRKKAIESRVIVGRTTNQNLLVPVPVRRSDLILIRKKSKFKFQFKFKKLQSD